MPSRRRSDSSPQRRHPITEAIAKRAYELFLARGGENGHDLDDWLRAERELLDAAHSQVQDIKDGAAAGKHS
jgi:Protein of unknown function (DUF2934)